MIDALENLDFDVALGFQSNADEFRGLLRTIRAINVDESPHQWALRCTMVGRSRGRQGDGTDFVYYNPTSRKRISTQRAQEIQRIRREITDGNSPLFPLVVGPQRLCLRLLK